MSTETDVSDERLAMIAIAAASAQPWESRRMAAECLAHRIANRTASSRKLTDVFGPTVAKEPAA